MKIAIDMLDDDGLVTETIEDVHVCVGDDAGEPARCETCGAVASPEHPVYVWTSGTGLDYFVCYRDLVSDAYARPNRTLETGDVVAVLSADGAVAYQGEITSLPGDDGKYGIYNPQTDEVHYVAEAGGEGFRPATESESDAYIDRWE